MNPLFTIGHSTHEIGEFLGLLRQHEIDAVADVRSQPYSSRFPWFSQKPLESALEEAGVRYVFLGQELGARRDEPECYDGRRADYVRIAVTPAFQLGLERLRKGLAAYRITLLCAEKDPLDCHRTILVCRHARVFAEIQHIRFDGSLESHAAAEERLLKRCKIPSTDLFRSHESLLAQAYDERGREIAWVETDSSSDEP